MRGPTKLRVIGLKDCKNKKNKNYWNKNFKNVVKILEEGDYSK